MTSHLVWIRTSVAAAIVAGLHVWPAAAQYAPYQPQAQPGYGYPTTAQQGAAPAAEPVEGAYQPPVSPRSEAAPSAYPSTSTTTAAYPQTPYPSTPYPSTAYPSTSYPQTSYPQTAARYPSYPTYPSVAQQPAEATPPAASEAPPAASETLPLPPAAADGAPLTAPPASSEPTPAAEPSLPSVPEEVLNGGSGAAPITYYPGDASGYGSMSGCSNQDENLSGYFDNTCGGTQWFGGVYFLYMERDAPTVPRLAAQVETSGATFPYYPTAGETVLCDADIDYDYRPGGEVRFGSTFGVGSACNAGYYGGYGYGNGCGSGQGCGNCPPPQMYAWEAAYWILDDHVNQALVIDGNPTDTYRIYGMRNFIGLEFDRDGGGGAYSYRPVNDAYAYQVPVEDPALDPLTAGDIRVVAQRVRTDFSAQNVELNFLRLPMMCGGSGCGAGSSFSLTGLCGVRYVRLDDDFQYATKFIEYDGADWQPAAYSPFDAQSDNELFYNVSVDNHLTGFQFGGLMNYCVACKWNFFCDTNFGLYGNHIVSDQRLWSGGGGTVRFINGQWDAAVSSDKDDVSFMGEMRLGGSYDFNCHWRGVLAYRALAITGVALSTEQMPLDFADAETVGVIDSDSSIIIHGVQAGAEFRY